MAFAVCHSACRLVLGSGPEAEDAAQDALIRAWRGRASCRTQEAPAGWWATIARREALRRLERAAWQRELLAAEPQGEGEAESLDVDGLAERLDLERALVGLAAGDRALVELRYRRDLSQPEVAERLGIAEGTAKVRLHRLRERLRDELRC